MTHVRKWYTLSKDNKTEHYEVYDQPRRDWLVAQAYNAWWHMSWRAPVIKHVFNAVDKIDVKLHRRGCDDKCLFDFSLDSDRKICIYMPFTNRMDMKQYDLAHKNETVLGSTPRVECKPA